MNNIKVSINYNGIGQLLKSEGVRQMLDEKVEEIENRCGEGYESYVKYRQTRLVGTVYAETQEAMQDNYDNNTLLRAIR